MYHSLLTSARGYPQKAFEASFTVQYFCFLLFFFAAVSVSLSLVLSCGRRAYGCKPCFAKLEKGCIS